MARLFYLWLGGCCLALLRRAEWHVVDAHRPHQCKILKMIHPKQLVPHLLVCISIYSILLHYLRSWLLLKLTVYQSW